MVVAPLTMLDKLENLFECFWCAKENCSYNVLLPDFSMNLPGFLFVHCRAASPDRSSVEADESLVITRPASCYKRHTLTTVRWPRYSAPLSRRQRVPLFYPALLCWSHFGHLSCRRIYTEVCLGERGLSCKAEIDGVGGGGGTDVQTCRGAKILFIFFS